MQPVIRTQQSRGGVGSRLHKLGIAAVTATCCISLTFMGFASEAQAGPRFGRAVAIGIGAAAVLGIAGAAMANQRRPVATAKPSGSRSSNKATASTKSSTRSASKSSSKGKTDKAEDVAKVQPADNQQVVPVKPPPGEPNSALSYSATGGSGPQVPGGQGAAPQAPSGQNPAAAQPAGGASVAQTPAAQPPSQGPGTQGSGAKPGDRAVQSAQAPSNLPLPVSMVTEIGE